MSHAPERGRGYGGFETLEEMTSQRLHAGVGYDVLKLWKKCGAKWEICHLG